MRYDTFGFREMSLAEAVEFVEAALGVTFSVRESEYRGVYYHSGPFDPPNLTLYGNERDGGWLHPDLAGYRAILLVNGFEDMDAIQRRLTEGRADPTLLRTRTTPD